MAKNGKSCGRRVGVLYLLPGGQSFGCRRCYNLTYQSVQQHDKRLDLLLRLPVQNLNKVLHEDAIKLGTLGIRIGAILARRLRKKAERRRGRRQSMAYTAVKNAKADERRKFMLMEIKPNIPPA
jgi:hypothetical protein